VPDEVDVGTTATSVKLAGGLLPVALATPLETWATAVVTACAAAPGGSIVIAPLDPSVAATKTKAT
jgi:hypothetical protein